MERDRPVPVPPGASPPNAAPEKPATGAPAGRSVSTTPRTRSRPCSIARRDCDARIFALVSGSRSAADRRMAPCDRAGEAGETCQRVSLRSAARIDEEKEPWTLAPRPGSIRRTPVSRTRSAELAGPSSMSEEASVRRPAAHPRRRRPPVRLHDRAVRVGSPGVADIRRPPGHGAGVLNTLGRRVRSGDHLLPGQVVTFTEWPHRIVPELGSQPGGHRLLRKRVLPPTARGLRARAATQLRRQGRAIGENAMASSASGAERVCAPDIDPQAGAEPPDSGSVWESTHSLKPSSSR